MKAETRVAAILNRCGTPESAMPPTQLYNEGWMLRLVLDWFSGQPPSEHDLSFESGSRWYSEALLPSRFFATKRGDTRAEGWTNADAVVGHFQLRKGGRGDIEIVAPAKQLVIVEAKLGSGLSAGVKNAPTFNQAARNVACLCHLVEHSAAALSEGIKLGFFVVAPQSRINEGLFGPLLDLDGPSGIKAVVAERVHSFAPDLDGWHEKHFLSVLSRITIRALSWEDILSYIQVRDSQWAGELQSFYSKCLKHNRLASTDAVTGEMTGDG